jgi:flagellar hook-associated protein 2
MASFSTNYSAALGNILSQVNDAFSGKSSGIDVSSVVNSMMQVEDQPEMQMKDEQSSLDAQISALTTIDSELSTLSNSVNSLQDFNGALDQFTTGSSDAAVVSAAASATATSGAHTVTVSDLATASTSYSGYLSAGALAGTEISVQYGTSSPPTSTDTIDIPSTDTTLQKAANYINAGSYGVTASVVTDAGGSRLALTSKTSGVAGSLTVSGAATSFTSTAGTDAHLTVDGVPVDSPSNTVTGAITGVTLSLGAADPNNSILITVEPDTTQAAGAIESFVDSYNAVVGSINSQYALNSNGTEGILAGDSMLQSLQSSLLDMVSTAVSGNGQYANLQSLGIEMQNNGTLQIDSSTLSDALSSSYTEVQNFFQSTAPLGWAETAGKEMTQLTDPTKGPVAADISGLNQSNSDLSTQISDFEANMSEVQKQLTSQYDNLDTLLIQYPLQMQEAAAQLASLPGSTTSTSSSSSGL